MRVAVVGCGVFGALCAIRLLEAGHQITVIDRAPGPLEGASYNNQNRLHLGYHYPRDEETARQCVRGFDQFRAEFSACIVAPSENAYFVAEAGSKTTPADYLAFADRLGQASRGAPPRRIDPGTFSPAVRGVAVGVSAPEVLYDCGELRQLLRQRLCGVRQLFKVGVAAVEREREQFRLRLECGAADVVVDAVINCTYAETNRLGAPLGHPLPTYQYEYTALPIIEWAAAPAPVGITIMDGPFLTVLPFGRSGQFLLYHVEHSVLARAVGTQLPAAWRDPKTAPAPPAGFFSRLRDAACAFVPALRGARQVGCLQGPRVVLAQAEHTDARPSLVNAPEPRFVNVFSGKIDHCIWAAEDVVARLTPTD